MVDESTLAMNVLTFRAKSFGYERSFELGGEGYALFQRTETENESKLRPKLLHLSLVAPLEWIVYDEAADTLRLDREGNQITVLSGAPAQELAAEPEEFVESGIRWRRRSIRPDAVLYLPEDRAKPLTEEPAGREALRGMGLLP